MSVRNPFRDPRPSDGGGVPYITYAMCAVCVVVSVAFWLTGMRENSWGAVSAERIWGGDYGGLITSTFLHDSPQRNPLHLFFNMLWLVRLGSIIERNMGRLEFGVFCAGAAFTASGVELAVTGNDSIGMSGVVYALFGLMWVSRRTYPAFAQMATSGNARFFIGWLVLCLALTEAHYWDVANFAHIGGLAFGVGVGWLLVEQTAPPRRKAGGAALLAVVVALTACALFYLPWSARWRYWRAVTPAQHTSSLPLYNKT